MTRLRMMHCTFVVLAGIGLVTPRCTLRAGEAPVRKAVADVALNESGDLTGAVTSSAGKPVDGALVTLTRQGKAVAQTTTDAEGEFELASVKSGTYELNAGPVRRVVRVWSADAAPPAAVEQAHLVVEPVVRGQEDYYGGDYFEAGGLDFISLATVVTSTGALAVSIVNQTDLNDLKDDVKKLGSP